jgi:hypothetical protein
LLLSDGKQELVVGFEWLLEHFHKSPINNEISLSSALAESHRHISGQYSLLGPPYYPQIDDDEFLTDIPRQLRHFAFPFTQCFIALTSPSQSWWEKIRTWIIPGTQVATHKAIQTTYFALDSMRSYIRQSPFESHNLVMGSVLFNAILEALGLPSLNINFGDERWASDTLRAMDGDLEPLLTGVLEVLLLQLGENPQYS